MYSVKGISNGYLLHYTQPACLRYIQLIADAVYDCGKEQPMEITYTRVGDYLLPDITLREKPPPDGFGEPLGRYARMRRAYPRGTPPNILQHAVIV